MQVIVKCTYKNFLVDVPLEIGSYKDMDEKLFDLDAMGFKPYSTPTQKVKEPKEGRVVSVTEKPEKTKKGGTIWVASIDIGNGTNWQHNFFTQGAFRKGDYVKLTPNDNGYYDGEVVEAPASNIPF